MVVNYLWQKGFSTWESTNQMHHAVTQYFRAKEGDVIVIPDTNPQTYQESEKCRIYKFIYQIDAPKKFTVGNQTFIRKTGDLVLSDGVIEYAGFDLFREVILQLMTFEEAKKIIDSWT